LSAVYGKQQSFKTFVTMHLSMCVAMGEPWAGRKTRQSPVVYIAAEGSSGLRKRKAGLERVVGLPVDLPFYLVSAAPNLGIADGDVAELLDEIDAAKIGPGLIVIDTLARTLYGADENKDGMSAFIGNASEMERRFGCMVMTVHHVGHSEEAQRRPRGGSTLGAAIDTQILCERQGSDMTAILTVQKVKDDIDGFRLSASLQRILLGHDEEDDEISTLAVTGVSDVRLDQPIAKKVKPVIAPFSYRALTSWKKRLPPPGVTGR
jgi:RecA-family ATPase